MTISTFDSQEHGELSMIRVAGLVVCYMFSLGTLIGYSGCTEADVTRLFKTWLQVFTLDHPSKDSDSVSRVSFLDIFVPTATEITSAILLP